MMLASGQRGAPCESLIFLQGQVVQPENTLFLQDSKRKCPALGRAGLHWACWPSCLHSIGQGKSSREEPALGILSQDPDPDREDHSQMVPLPAGNDVQCLCLFCDPLMSVKTLFHAKFQRPKEFKKMDVESAMS